MHSKQNSKKKKESLKSSNENPTRWSKYLNEREWANNTHKHIHTAKTQAVNATASEGHRKRHHPQSKQTHKTTLLLRGIIARAQAKTSSYKQKQTKYLVIGRENWKQNTNTQTQNEKKSRKKKIEQCIKT